jgi:hypothetical protein
MFALPFLFLIPAAVFALIGALLLAISLFIPSKPKD